MSEKKPAEEPKPGPKGTPTTDPRATRFVSEGILAIICQFLSPRWDPIDPEFNDPEAYRQVPKQVLDDRHALASLAQTCRPFSEVALNELWRQLDSPEPLLRLLLVGMRRVAVDDSELAGDVFEGKTTVFIQPHPPEQLKRFRLYSKRVESLFILRETSIHSSAFFQAALLCGAHAQGRLLPSLKDLYCESSEIMDQAIVLFASQGLRRVTLNLAMRTKTPPSTVTRTDVALSGVMVCLARTAPAIQELSITPLRYIQALNNISALQKLEVLDIGGADCDDELLLGLSRLQHLTSLTLTASAAQKNYLIQSDGFAKLKRIHFVGGTFLGVARILLLLGQSKPTSITVEGAVATSVSCLRQLAISALSVCMRAADTLDALSIHGEVHQPEQDKKATIVGEAEHLKLEQFLQPFAVCKKLTAFTLSLKQLVTISNEGLSYLASRWPLLDLVTTSVAKPLPSFEGITKLLGACPRLRILKLPMLAAPTLDPIVWPVLDNALEVLVVAKQLYPLRPAPVCINEREVIAQIADRLFPRLDEDASCKATRELPGGVKCRWRRIVDELAYIRFLRRERGEPDIFVIKATHECMKLSAKHWLVGGAGNGIRKLYKRVYESSQTCDT